LNLTTFPLLDIRNLSVSYYLSSQVIRAVRNISLQIPEGETIALVGETGSGKSTVALSTIGLLGYRARIESGEILFEGRSMPSSNSREWKNLRSRKIGVVFQDARSALNPVLSVQDHLLETLRSHQKLSKKQAQEAASQVLQEVGIPELQKRLYPFELSGGACQRIGIALAVCNRPRLLIADEPVSAVDVTLQAQILELLANMKQRHNLAMLLISHDLPLTAQVADRICVLYHGRIVECGLRDEVFGSPAHPYTLGLIQSQPSLEHHHETNPLTAIPGSIPEPGKDPAGCLFAPRCPDALPRCVEAVPEERTLSGTHRVACIRHPREKEPGNS
jgi:oligopeptide/dipeptide ABC transporter ATP-binding protein